MAAKIARPAMSLLAMMYFKNLDEIVTFLDVDKPTKKDPIKWAFVLDGEHLTANIGMVSDNGEAFYTQSYHDELLVIIDGDVDFKVGEETKTGGAAILYLFPRQHSTAPF